MRLCVLSATPDDISVTLLEENWSPEEMEYRLVQLADEKFSDYKQLFFFDSEQNPALDLIKDGKIAHQIRYEYEI
jgi:hypothetical protein